MKALKPLLCAVVALAAAMAAPLIANAQSIKPQTRWVNNHGSELYIQSIGPDGSLAGTYSSSQPDYRCRNVAFPIVGWVDGALISYTMRASAGAAECGTITSWTGYVRDGRLYAEWSLAYMDAETFYPGLTRGTDVYRPK